jgi:transposase
MRAPDERTGPMFAMCRRKTGSGGSSVADDSPPHGSRPGALSPTFDSLYVNFRRPSVPPEQLLRALLLQVPYSIRSERLLMEQLDYNILFRWFVGVRLDESVWDPTTFMKNRNRRLRGDVAAAFFDAVHADSKGLLSDEHFMVDGTHREAWVSLKSLKRRDATPSEPPYDPGNATVNFRGETRSNATHTSTTDPDAQLYKKAAG